MAPPAPVPAPAYPPARPKLRPSAAWYWIGGVLIALGVIGFLVVLSIWFVRASDAVDKFARVIVPPEGAQADLQFKKAGEYTLYYEYRSKVDGQSVNNSAHDPPSQLAVTVTDANGTDIPVKPYTNDFSVSVNDKLGPAFGKVNIPAPGTYTMKVTSDATAPFVIAIGKGVLQSIWPWWILGALAILVLGLALGLFSIISTAVKRGRRKRELRRAQQTSVGGPAPAYAGAAAAAGSEAAWSTPPPPTWGTPPPSGGYPPPAPVDRPADRPPLAGPPPSSPPSPADQPSSAWPSPGDGSGTVDRRPSDDSPSGDHAGPAGGAAPEWPSPGERQPSAGAAASGAPAPTDPDASSEPAGGEGPWAPPQR
jgi:hypothetical protein